MLFSNLFLSSLGPGEIMLLLLLVLIFFGGKKIPELMRGLGQGVKEFNKAKASIEEEVKDGIRELDANKK
jgi:sec-independent protein translocase protein TatA